MKIGFFGDGPWSHNALKNIYEDPELELAFICVRSDPGDEYLIEFAQKKDITLLQNKNINSDQFKESLRGINFNLIVSLAFNQIFKKPLLDMPKYGAINCHAGKLPDYRGRNILNWALINDEKEFGITVHFIDEGIDTGDIIIQESFEIKDSDNYKSLLDLAHLECGNLVYKAIKQIQKGNYKTIKQDEIGKGFYCIGRKEGDEKINWNQSSRDLFNFIRALCTPGPNAYSNLNGKKIQIISSFYDVKAKKFKGIPGSIIGINKDFFLVKTNDSYLKVTEYIFDGKLKIGDRFG